MFQTLTDLPESFEQDEGTNSRRAKHPEDVFVLTKEYISSTELRQKPLLVMTPENRDTYPSTTTSNYVFRESMFWNHWFFIFVFYVKFWTIQNFKITFFFTFHLEPYSVFRNHSNKTGGPKHPKTVERSCPNFCATAWGKRRLSTSCQLPECFSWWHTPCRGSDSSYMAWGGLCDWGYAHSPRRTPSCCFGNTLPKRPPTRSLETQAVIQKQKLSFWKPHDTLTYEICFCKTMSFWIHHKRWEVGWPKRGPQYYVWCGKKNAVRS